MTSKWLDIIAYDDCCGCEACVSSCPHSCITMKEDDKGFLRPWINTANCTRCNLCTKSCPILSPHDPTEPLHVYACKNSDEDIRMKSSSGGAFTAFATKIINDGGVVYGAAFNPDFSVHHSRVDNHDDLALLRGSKYVQSSIDGAYRAAKKDLALGIPVLFSGTPCQIAGLKSFLGNKTFPNLYCIEIVCLGVPSPSIFQHYVSFLEKKHNATIKSFKFRDKTTGWTNYQTVATSIYGSSYETYNHKDPYIQGFINGLFIRNSCFNCHFKNFKSKADITLGDFWGCDQINKLLNDNKGTSLICISSEKGINLFHSIKSFCVDIHPSTLEIATQYNSCIVKSISPHPLSHVFFEKYRTSNFSQLIFDLCNNHNESALISVIHIKFLSFLQKIKRFLYNCFKYLRLI